MTFIFLILNLLMLATTPSFADSIYANELPYDHVSLNSNTWQEVDMVYQTTINGKTYLNTINLLRPKAYLAQYHINQVGQKLTLTLPEIGLNNNIVTITVIKPAPDFTVCQQHNYSQVIGLFKHYATNVKTYRFKDLKTGTVSIVHATTNHPFYVKNKHQFLPISQVTGNDQLVGKSNHLIKLLCAPNQLVHCGVGYNNQKPTMVYNLEVYRQHHYEVGQDDILVHNTCDDNLTIDSLREKGTKIGDGGYKEVYTLPNSDGYVYSFFKNGNTVFGKETAIERTLRVAREVNLDVPEFKIEAVGVNKDILKMTKLEITETLSIGEQESILAKYNNLLSSNRLFADIRIDNIGWLNGQPVFFDIDNIVGCQSLDGTVAFDDLSVRSQSYLAHRLRMAAASGDLPRDYTIDITRAKFPDSPYQIQTCNIL